MTTKLDKTIKREIDIDGEPYTVAISPEGVKLTQKGFRKGQEMTWTQLLAAGGGGSGGGNASASGSGGSDGGGASSSSGSAGGAGSSASSGVGAIDLRDRG
jgi:hypothetical protein